MKAQIFLLWVNLLYFNHSTFSETLSFVQMKQHLNKIIGHHSLLEPHRHAVAASTGRESQRTEGSTHLTAPTEVQKRIPVYWSLIVFLFMVPGASLELLLLLLAVLSGLLESGLLFSSLIYYPLHLVLCIFFTLSGPQKLNYSTIFKSIFQLFLRFCAEERELSVHLFAIWKVKAGISTVKKYFWKCCFETVFRPWNTGLGIY